MEGKIQELLSFYSEIDFGSVEFSGRQHEFYNEFNNEVILLCKSLPQPLRTDVMLFIMRLLKIPFEQELNFFKFTYVPTWSIIYWLIQCLPSGQSIEEKDIKNAKSAHSMAVLLHYLDHQLNDHEMMITHLSLLLRSQMWMLMNNAINGLAEGVDGGERIVKGFINDYYCSICGADDIKSLNSYCDLFRKQMATGFITPVLLTKKTLITQESSDAIQSAYGSFGVAWRLLDDMQDIKQDMEEGAQSSIYICLPENIKKFWYKPTREQVDKKNDYAMIIMDCIVETSIINRIRKRICSELESAASIADDYAMKGLAAEFRCMLKPLKNFHNRK